MGPKAFIGGVWQGQSAPGDVRANLRVVEEKVRESLAQGVELLVFPELYLTGYDIGPAKLQEAAVAKGSAVLEELAEIAKAYSMALCVPLPEKEGDAVYNSAALFDCTGELVLMYRKTHLWSTYEKDVFTPGGPDALSVVDLALRCGDSIKVGVLICFDIEFPEPARVLRLKGAEVLLVPTALGSGPADHITPLATVPARAAENAVFLLYSNLQGKNHEMEFCGSSAIIAPDGSEAVRAGRSHDALLVARLDPSQYGEYKARNPYLTDRRPELYSAIAARHPCRKQA